MLRIVSRSWTRTWVGPAGLALTSIRIANDHPVLITAEGATFGGD